MGYAYQRTQKRYFQKVMEKVGKPKAGMRGWRRLAMVAGRMSV